MPRKPRCPACPLRHVCAGLAEGEPDQYPKQARRKAVPHKRVGAAVVVNSRGQVLIAQRKEGSMLGGLWEFPGGSLEPGETMEACIARELKEELDIDVAVGAHLMTVRHAFSHFTMDLHVHWARLIRGRPKALHCNAWRWATVKDLSRYAFGRADRHVVERLGREPKLPVPGKTA